jgi:hypothetical protein
MQPSAFMRPKKRVASGNRSTFHLKPLRLRFWFAAYADGTERCNTRAGADHPKTMRFDSRVFLSTSAVYPDESWNPSIGILQTAHAVAASVIELLAIRVSAAPQSTAEATPSRGCRAYPIARVFSTHPSIAVSHALGSSA